MTMTAEKIVTEALALTPQARAFMIEQLIESLDTVPGEKLSSPWNVEIQKRIREIDEGAVELLETAAVFAKAYATLG
jgi:putative addiction module component (TIGR02574 family)